MSDTSRIGQIIQGRYRLERLLGAGGFGTVFEARHLEMGTQVALKILHPEHTRDARTVKRFELEAKRSASLKHPNTIRVFDYGHTEQGELFIAMEFLEGRSLKHVLAHEHPLALSRVVHILAQILRALDEAHLTGLVHRDLKPDNVFLLEIGREKDFVKVLDFGIAKAMREDTALTTTGTLIGTPLYMSPEQCRGKELDGRSDLYSLGCMAFELLTGRTPFHANDAFGFAIAHLQEAPPDPRAVAGPERPLPEGLVAWVLRLLAKDPEDRFPDAAAANEALAGALAGAATWEFRAPTEQPDVRSAPTLAASNHRPPPSGSPTPPPEARPATVDERRPSERETRDEPTPRRPGKPWWFWTGLGVIGLGAIAAVVIALWPRTTPTPHSSFFETSGNGADTPTDLAGEVLEDDVRLAPLLRFLPRSTWFVVAVRPDMLRRSMPLTLGFQRMTDAIYQSSPLGAIGVPQVLADTGLLVMGITGVPDGAPPIGRVVALDSPDPGRVRQPAIDAGARVEADPIPWVRMPDGGGFVVEPGRVVIASAKAADDMIGARLGEGQRLGGELAEMLARVAPGAPAFAVMEMPAQMRGDLDGEVPGLGRARLLGGRLRFEPKTGLVIHLDFRDDALASEVRREIERKLAELRSPGRQAGIGMNELGLLGSLRTRVEGSLITLEADIPDDALATLLETLGVREQTIEPAPTETTPPPEPMPGGEMPMPEPNGL